MFANILRIFNRVIKRALSFFSLCGFFHWIPDEQYLRLRFWQKLDKKLDLKHPKSFNEKLQWLKLYDRKPIYTTLVDKQAVKKYVADIIGTRYIIPTLGVWERFDDIDFSSLPNQFVLKCTHDSGGIVVCKNKADFNTKEAKKRINRSLKRNYYYHGREWPYKNVKPQIIAERYMEDHSGTGLNDYKFFCFNGVPRAMFIATDRNSVHEETKFDFYDMDFIHLPFTNGHPNSRKRIECPSTFELMKKLASTLSVGFPHIRVDFYEINEQVYFGELTLYHWSGLMPFVPEEWDYKFGEWLEL